MQIQNTLYKEASAGNIQQWKVFVTGNKITVEFGQVGGKLQTKDTTCFPKNIGKANETSAEEQAKLEAIAKWQKQVKKGYVECSSGKRVINLPMKVESYFKGKMRDKIVFPAYIGRKLNGVNAECRLIADNTIIQLSRGGEQYPLPPAKAQQELISLMKVLNATSLNYEIYLHNHYLQDIVGAVKAPLNHKDVWENLTYNVFDIPSNKNDWKTRWSLLSSVNVDNNKYVRIVENSIVNDHTDIVRYHNKFIAEGYEGAIVRNGNGLYEYNARSMDVLKVKHVMSNEFLITSYYADKNNQPVFSCKSLGGEFKVKPKGTAEQRQEILKSANSWIGKWMTIEYEMMSKDNIPLKPVGIGLRNGYEENGVFIPTE